MSLDARRIGLVVYSQTGNTNSVAERLKHALEEKGYTADILRLQLIGEAKPGTKSFEFAEIPDISTYDSVMFASPVHAFSLAPMMNSFFSHVPTLQGKLVSLFVTHHFPYAWMGGSRALAQMRTLCAIKGAVIGESRVISWSSKKRERDIEELIASISGQLGEMAR